MDFITIGILVLALGVFAFLYYHERNAKKAAEETVDAVLAVQALLKRAQDISNDLRENKPDKPAADKSKKPKLH